MVCPVWVTLRFETVGRWVPVGQAVTKPGRVALVAVRLSATATTPDDGTAPTPVTCRSIDPLDGTAAIGAPRPVRVSSMREGVTGVNFAADAGGAAPAVPPFRMVTSTAATSASTSTNTNNRCHGRI